METTIVRRITAGAVGIALAASSAVGWARGPRAIHFRVDHVEGTDGHVRCGLFAHEERWLDETPAYRSVARIHRGHAVCVFPGIPDGVYAATALHDADDDGEMDRGPLGLPREGYAISNNAHLNHVGAPRWEDARFTYGGGASVLAARMRY